MKILSQYEMQEKKSGYIYLQLLHVVYTFVHMTWYAFQVILIQLILQYKVKDYRLP